MKRDRTACNYRDVKGKNQRARREACNDLKAFIIPRDKIPVKAPPGASISSGGDTACCHSHHVALAELFLPGLDCLLTFLDSCLVNLPYFLSRGPGTSCLA